MFAIAVVATSCKHGAPRTATDTPSVRVAYEEPKDPAHRPQYAEVRARRVLEQVAEVLAVVRLPKQLLLVFKGCDGESNAFYSPVTTSITFCYEYLADIEKMAAENVVDGRYVGIEGSDERVPLDEAIDGPVVFILFHEAGHAVYNLLKIPVLGRQEDAADFFAAIAILRFGNEFAMRHLRGAAWLYAVGAQRKKADVSALADAHSLDPQRYFNILCLAYGSDPDYFAVAVKRGNLPEARAKGCGFEYAEANYALQKLVMPFIDEAQWENVRMKYQGKPGASPSPAGR